MKPALSLGIKPARTKEDFPQPEPPTTAKNRFLESGLLAHPHAEHDQKTTDFHLL